jgi:hypothetical protein
MGLWDYVIRRDASTPTLDDRFTTEEIRRLTALWQQLAVQPAHVDLGFEVRRLEFARWLVEHGHLGEEISPSATNEPAKWDAA